MKLKEILPISFLTGCRSSNIYNKKRSNWVADFHRMDGLLQRMILEIKVEHHHANEQFTTITFNQVSIVGMLTGT